MTAIFILGTLTLFLRGQTCVHAKTKWAVRGNVFRDSLNPHAESESENTELKRQWCLFTKWEMYIRGKTGSATPGRESGLAARWIFGILIHSYCLLRMMTSRMTSSSIHQSFSSDASPPDFTSVKCLRKWLLDVYMDKTRANINS